MSEGNGKLYLDAAAIFEMPRRYADIDVPQWGGRVRVRGLSARQALELGNVPENIRIGQAIALCVVDGDGRPKFTAADAEKLMDLDAAPIMQIHNEIMRLSNGLDESGLEAARKNSESTPSDGSHSA